MLTQTKKSRMVVLISDKSEFRMRKMIRDKLRELCNSKGSILQEGTKILMCMCLTTKHKNKCSKNSK